MLKCIKCQNVMWISKKYKRYSSNINNSKETLLKEYYSIFSKNLIISEHSIGDPFVKTTSLKRI